MECYNSEEELIIFLNKFSNCLLHNKLDLDIILFHTVFSVIKLSAKIIRMFIKFYKRKMEKCLSHFRFNLIRILSLKGSQNIKKCFASVKKIAGFPDRTRRHVRSHVHMQAHVQTIWHVRCFARAKL